MLFGTDGFQIELRWFYIERRRTLLRHIEPFDAVWNRSVPNRTLPVPHGTAKNYFFSECRPTHHTSPISVSGKADPNE